MESNSPRIVAALNALTKTFLPPYDIIPSPKSSTIELSELFIHQHKDALKRFWGVDLTSSSSGNSITESRKNTATNPSSFLSILLITLNTKLNKPTRLKLTIFLYILSSPVGSFCLFGRFSKLLQWKAFPSWTLEERIDALKELRDSCLEFKRAAFNGLKQFICGVALSHVVTDGTDDERAKVLPMRMNPFWEAMGYPGPIHHYETKESDEMLTSKVHQLPKDAFIEPSQQEQQQSSMEFDVIIVGSGAGGSVAASTLSSAGYSVLILDKGQYIPPKDITNLEVDAMDSMYEGHALVTSTDGNIMILAGSTVGGGTAINWGCCIDTPTHVRKEWADRFGLVQFEPSATKGEGISNEFDFSLNAVKDRIGGHALPEDNSDVGNISEDGKSSPPHNIANTLLLQSCQELGYDVKATGRNFQNPSAESAGYTCFGDRYGNKQSTTVTFLADALECGAKIIENCSVDEILTAPNNVNDRGKGSHHRPSKAVGVKARVGDMTFSIKARKCVICSAGSLHTPCLLLRSKFKNPHIGQHLHLHPVIPCLGCFSSSSDETSEEADAHSQLKQEEIPSRFDGCIKANLCAPMTVVCNEFQHQNRGYGCKIEVPSTHPGLGAAAFPWLDPVDYKSKLLRVQDMIPLIALQRDCGGGRVTLNHDGFHPKIDYTLSKEDEKSMLNGLDGCIEILLQSRADYINTFSNSDYGLDVDKERQQLNSSHGDSNNELDDLKSRENIQRYRKQIQDNGIVTHRNLLFSAHQMGSSRMGISPKNSVVDQNGELWECANLFVLDASIFPTASGANPMLTTLSISHMLSTRLAKKLRTTNADSK